MTLENPKLQDYAFLKFMYEDDYYPNLVVDKGVKILFELCQQIERQKPTNETALIALTHTATSKFNDLLQDFWDLDSDIETMAREAIAEDFEAIVKAYGFECDIEEVIAPRDW